MKMVTILLTCWLGWIVQPAQALERVALVIGNATYPNLEQKYQLVNPLSDAKAVTEVLRRPELGFTVFYLENGSRAQMKDAVSQFARKLNSNTLGLFYFSGHGARVNGEEYLLASNFQGAKSKVDFKEGALVVTEVTNAMQQAGSPEKLLILDACRNNPLDAGGSEKGAKAIGIAFGAKDVTGAVKSQGTSDGFLIVYATAAGQEAKESEGLSFYTKHLLPFLDNPVLSFTDIVTQVRGAVIQETQSGQTPWESNSLLRPVYLAKVRMKATGDVP
jgi:uncharacterized caspase-like protein